MNFLTFECFSFNIGLTAMAIIYCNTRVDYTPDETLHNVIFERILQNPHQTIIRFVSYTYYLFKFEVDACYYILSVCQVSEFSTCIHTPIYYTVHTQIHHTI